MFRKILLTAVIAVLVTAPFITEFGTVSASSHREAPLISQDPLADNTDLYAFVSPDSPDTVTIIANYIPMETPASGPGFFNFDPNALYSIYVDNTGDAEPDVTFNSSSKQRSGIRIHFWLTLGPQVREAMELQAATR